MRIDREYFIRFAVAVALACYDLPTDRAMTSEEAAQLVKWVIDMALGPDASNVQVEPMENYPASSKMPLIISMAGVQQHPIERLSDEQALDLLEKKWIAPLIESIHKLPDTVIDSLVSKIQALQNKYATTFFEVEQQISETEATLSGMIDDLEGNEYDMLGLKELKKLLGGSAE